ncbi:MAG: ceramidase domain-containing protein [Methylococcales bacterium]|nr:ceramidase domain-containing protein [Methylococcales bacterium]
MLENISNQKKAIFMTVVILLISLLLITAPIPQDPAYHNLADDRHWFGISNFANVFSNVPFAMIGLMGLFLYSKNNSQAALSWQTFFIGLIFVAIGSSYYHLTPNNHTLVWDRLPMMISFMGLFIALLVENIPNFNEKPALPMAVLLGLSSVIYWHYLDDLRFYGFMQFAPLVAIPIILYVYKGRYTHRSYLLYGLLFYILAKVFELTDRLIFEQTEQLLSGHTIKHLLAAAATYCIYLMLKQRQPIND